MTTRVLILCAPGERDEVVALVRAAGSVQVDREWSAPVWNRGDFVGLTGTPVQFRESAHVPPGTYFVLPDPDDDVWGYDIQAGRRLPAPPPVEADLRVEPPWLRIWRCVRSWWA